MDGMTRTQIRTFVRDHLDVDDIELPDSLLDVFILDGHSRIDNFSRRWSFREVAYTFTVSEDTQAYDISSENSVDRAFGIDEPIASIENVRGPTSMIPYQDHARMRVDGSLGRAGRPGRVEPEAGVVGGGRGGVELGRRLREETGK